MAIDNNIPTFVERDPAVIMADLIPYISNDKKMRGNHMTLIILKEIGKGRLLPLAAEDLPKYIRKKDAQ